MNIQFVILLSIQFFQLHSLNLGEQEQNLIQNQEKEEFKLTECVQDKNECIRCSFDQMRSIKQCQKNTYIQHYLCTYVSNIDSTVNFVQPEYKSCDQLPVLIRYELLFGLSLFTLGTICLYFHRREKQKLHQALVSKIRYRQQ